jgi:hypothetical protein
VPAALAVNASTKPKGTMTDPSEAPVSSGAMPVLTAALGGFLIVLTILALQMQAGHDPALKPSAAATPQRSILERRIIKTRVIITEAPRANAGVPAGLPAPSAPVVAVRAAPVQAAPVAPAPAPTPVTRSS